MGVNSYPLKGAVEIQIYDGGTHTFNLKFFAEGIEIPANGIVIDKKIRPVLDRGTFSHVEEDDDDIQIPEASFDVIMIDGDVEGNLYQLEQIMNNHKFWNGTTLVYENAVSTNDGNGQYAPASLFTLGLKVLFDNGKTGKAFGKQFKYVQPIPGTFKLDKDAKFTLKFRVLDGANDVVDITSL
jgi:hypothetical protein